ncbi:MAG: CocE/NonD family hydrolase [Actinomycetota bacterium]
MTRGKRFGAACIALVFLLAPAVAAADPPRSTAGAPADYTKVKGLSAAVHEDIVTDTLMLPMRDGVSVYIEVTRPAQAGRYPTIAEISPYHGTLYERDGWRMLPEQDGLVPYFVPRGYAVVMMDLRGTGRSQGCLDHMGPNDQGDAKEVIEWAASQAWSNGRVGVIGHSYPGGTSVMSLAEQPKGLATIVVSAGLGSMYEHQFQAGVPFLGQWLGPMEAYEQLAIERHLPGGDNFGNDMQYFGCGLPQSSLVAGEAQLSGKYVKWHSERDFRKHAAAARVPVFVIHGTLDNAARIASLDWFVRRNGQVRTRSGRPVVDKAWIGQWDHGSGCCPNRRGYQWTKALHAWFDRQLGQRNVDTGPPVEIFLADSTQDAAAVGARTEMVTARRFPGSPRTVTFYPDATGDLSSLKPLNGAEVPFAGDPTGVFQPQSTGGATFRSRPLEQNILFAGVPKLRLAASVTTPRVHLIVSLYDENPDGERRRMTQFAINPELRHGIGSTELVIPGKRYVMRPPGFPMAHHLKKGHRLVMRVTLSDPDKIPLFAVDPLVRVFTGQRDTVLSLPVIDRPAVYRDTLSLKAPKRR